MGICLVVLAVGDLTTAPPPVADKPRKNEEYFMAAILDALAGMPPERQRSFVEMSRLAREIRNDEGARPVAHLADLLELLIKSPGCLRNDLSEAVANERAAQDKANAARTIAEGHALRELWGWWARRVRLLRLVLAWSGADA